MDAKDVKYYGYPPMNPKAWQKRFAAEGKPTHRNSRDEGPEKLRNRFGPVKSAKGDGWQYDRRNRSKAFFQAEGEKHSEEKLPAEKIKAVCNLKVEEITRRIDRLFLDGIVSAKGWKSGCDDENRQHEQKKPEGDFRRIILRAYQTIGLRIFPEKGEYD